MTVKSFSLPFILVFLLFAGSARADIMPFPLVCEAGQSCFIIGYPDMARDTGIAEDYACGPATTDGDPFLRIGLPDVATLLNGVGVVAVKDGEVVDMLDGFDDLVAASKIQIKKGTPNCGNGVVLKHDDGLTTAYCHLKKGSIRVAKGDRVNAGQIIGLAGQSGVALWPQLGFSMQKKGVTIDPITGGSPFEGCGFKLRYLLAVPEGFREYQPAAIVTLGFADAPQTAMPVALGQGLRLSRIHPSTASITLWGMIVGVKKNDHIVVRLSNPKGRVFHQQSFVIDVDKPRQLVNVSHPRGYAYWREGLYSGEVILKRQIKGQDHIIRRGITVEIGAED